MSPVPILENGCTNKQNIQGQMHNNIKSNTTFPQCRPMRPVFLPFTPCYRCNHKITGLCFMFGCIHKIIRELN